MVYLNVRYSVHHTFRKRDRIHGETDCQTCTNRDLEVVRKLQGLVYTTRMETGSILHLKYIWRVVSQLISDSTHTLHISPNNKV